MKESCTKNTNLKNATAKAYTFAELEVSNYICYVRI